MGRRSGGCGFCLDECLGCVRRGGEVLMFNDIFYHALGLCMLCDDVCGCFHFISVVLLLISSSNCVDLFVCCEHDISLVFVSQGRMARPLICLRPFL